MKVSSKIVYYLYLPRLKKLEREIGYRLIFHTIPDRYINGMMSCEMTKTWKNFGLAIARGQNYFTMGNVVNGISSRFDCSAVAYQSWLGGYTVKLASEKPWSLEDYFQLAIADQNSWLRWYGDPEPSTTIEGWKFTAINTMQLGRYSGTLYEFGCRTHSDVGSGHKTMKLRFAAKSMATLFNLFSPDLVLRAKAFIPKPSTHPYASLDLRGYIAIFDLEPKVKTILYGNGAVVLDSSSKSDTFIILKEDLLSAMKACEIIKV